MLFFRNMLRSFHHISDERPKNAVVKVVDHLVATAYRGGEICVARGEGIKHVMHHFSGNLCHGRKQGGGLNAASLRNQRYALGNVLGIVTDAFRSEEQTSELQSLMRISYDVFCLKNKNK